MSDPALTRVEFATYKPKSPSDPSLVPTAATVSFFHPGATVATTTAVDPYESDKPVDVIDVGTLTLGDSVTVGAGGAILIVDGIVSLTQITVTNPSGDTVSLPLGTRLLRPYNRPTLYLQQGGPRAPTSALTTHALTGRGSGYLVAGRFDYTVQPSGGYPVGYPDAPGGNYRDEIDWNDVRDFPSIQAAIDALPAVGGVVYLPTGFYDLTAGLTIDRANVALLGDGLGTVIRPDGNEIDLFDLLTVRAGRCRISSLLLDGRAAELGSKSCLVIKGPAFPGGNINACHLENVAARQAPKHGLWLNDALNTLLVNCEFAANFGEGVHLDKTTIGINGTRFLSCIFRENWGSGVVAHDAAGLTFYGCDFEANKGGSGTTQGNALEAHGCNRIEAYSCYIQDADTPSTAQQFMLFDNCRSAIVDSCWFEGNAKPPNRAVRFADSPWSRLTNNAAHNCGEFALFDANSNESVEFGNRDAAGSAVPPTFTMQGSVRVLGLSRGALGLYIYADDVSRPVANTLREGSMIWVSSPGSGNSKLQISDGTAWKNIALS